MFVKLFHFIFAVAIFFSYSGLIVNKHYCGQRLQDFSFYIQVNGCNGAHKAAKKQKTCSKHISTAPKEKGCCKDESEYLKMDTDWQVNTFEFKHFSDFSYTLIAAYSPLNQLSSTDWVKSEYLYYKPPLIRESLQVLYQSYRC